MSSNPTLSSKNKPAGVKKDASPRKTPNGQASAKFKIEGKDGLYEVQSTGPFEIVPLVRTKTEYFTEFIEAQAKALGLAVVINASYIKLPLGASYLLGFYPHKLPASESDPYGQVVVHGKLVIGSESPGKFNLSQDVCGSSQLSARLGNPPSTACAAIGGLGPIIVNRMPYGTLNTYRNGAPLGAPAVGEVDPKYRSFLTQKSAKMYSDIEVRGRSVGKTAVGYSSAKQRVLIIVQQDETAGTDVDGFRKKFLDFGAESALLMDCSSSATLYYEGKFLVRPASYKDSYLTVALGFR